MRYRPFDASLHRLAAFVNEPDGSLNTQRFRVFGPLELSPPHPAATMEASSNTAVMQDPFRILRAAAYPVGTSAETRSDAVGLQPELEHAELPHLARARRGAVRVGHLEHPVDQSWCEQLALARGR